MQKNPLLDLLKSHPTIRTGVVCLPEGNDPRTIAAADLLLNSFHCKGVYLLGDQTKIDSQLPATLQQHRGKTLMVVDRQDSKILQQTRSRITSVQTQKGRTIDEEALQRMASDPLFQAGTQLHLGQANCVVAGAVATTADVIRAALGTVGLAPGIKTVSGGFFMTRYAGAQSETYYYADAGVVIEPTAEQLVDIAAASCETWQRIMGTPPVVAFLSFSTKGSAKHPSADKVIAATQQFQAKYPSIEADGELQFDAAFVESIGSRKSPGSKVPGRANVFVFPDLNAGNIAYKITQRLAKLDAYGPILQGLALPYSDLSRGASADDIAVSALINILRT